MVIFWSFFRGQFSHYFEASSFPSLNIPSLETRRKIMCIQYYFRSQEIPKNNTTINIHDQTKDLLFTNKKRGPFPTGFIIRKYLREFDIGTPKISIQTTPQNPPWTIPNIKVCFELNQKCKKRFSPP